MTRCKWGSTKTAGLSHLLRHQFDRQEALDHLGWRLATDEFDPNSHLKEWPTARTWSPKSSASDRENIPRRIRFGPTSSW
jgi:hypothetical protein